MEKSNSEHYHIERPHSDVQGMESGNSHFYIEERLAHLSEDHRQYLLARHGTLDLDPIPDMNNADPYNWPQWRVQNSSSITTAHN